LIGPAEVRSAPSLYDDGQSAAAGRASLRNGFAFMPLTDLA
jgi:hypothetical protein